MRRRKKWQRNFAINTMEIDHYVNTSYPSFTQLKTGVSRNSRSRPFPRMKASNSRSRIMGMDFFIPFPFLKYGNGFFFIPFPFPNCGNGYSSYPGHSRIFYFTDRKQSGNWITVRETRLPFLQLPLHCSKKLY